MICDVTNDISWFHGCYVTERYLVTDSPDQSRAQVSKGCEVVRLGSGFVTAVPHTNQTNEIQPPLIRDYDGCIDLDQRGCITSHRINSVTKPPTQCLVRAKYPEIQVLRWWLAGVAIRAQIRGLEASHSPSRPVRDRWAGRLQGTLQLCNRLDFQICQCLHVMSHIFIGFVTAASV